jgi:hypothetical protein
MDNRTQNSRELALWAGGLFLAGRLILLVSLPLEGLKGYGDYWNFFAQANLGLPFRDFWTEFPPLFPFLSRMIYWLTGGREHAYVYCLAVLMSAFQAGSISVFHWLGSQMKARESLFKRTFLYLVLTIGLFYGWGYFDSLAVFLLLLGIGFAVKGDESLAGGAIAAGVLTKWFPILAAPAVIKSMGRRAAVRFLITLVLVVAVVWIGLYLAFPENTGFSLMAQGLKGSWESIWALVDGNLGTGNFGDVDHTLPAAEQNIVSREAVIPPWMTLLVIGGVGFYLWIRASLQEPDTVAAFTGLTIVLFFLWSPGYSPQWVLYLVPLVLLVLPFREAGLWSLTLILVNLLEWPVLLSRGLFSSLYWMIPLRTMLYILLGIRFYARALDNEPTRPSGEANLG